VNYPYLVTVHCWRCDVHYTREYSTHAVAQREATKQSKRTARGCVCGRPPQSVGCEADTSRWRENLTESQRACIVAILSAVTEEVTQ
jgi:hypothetical protein